MFLRILRFIVDWTKAHNCPGLEFEKWGLQSWVFCAPATKFLSGQSVWLVRGRLPSMRPVSLPNWIRYSFRAVDGAMPVVSIIGDSNLFEDYLHWQWEAEEAHWFPIFRTPSPEALFAESIVVCVWSLKAIIPTMFLAHLKGDEDKDWMMTRSALRNALIARDLSMPGLLEEVANIVGIWPLIVCYLKERKRKDVGEIWYNTWRTHWWYCLLILVV